MGCTIMRPREATTAPYLEPSVHAGTLDLVMDRCDFDCRRACVPASVVVLAFAVCDGPRFACARPT